MLREDAHHRIDDLFWIKHQMESPFSWLWQEISVLVIHIETALIW